MCAKNSVFASTREQPGAGWTVLVTQKGNPVKRTCEKSFHTPPAMGCYHDIEKKTLCSLWKKKDGEGLLFDMLAPDTDLPSKT